LTKGKPIFTDNSMPYQLPSGDFWANKSSGRWPLLLVLTVGLANPA
jgi:hypothetical protein